MLQTLRIDTCVEVPTGVRRRDEPVNDFDVALDPFAQSDPDVWPPPTPVDHRLVKYFETMIC